MRENIFSGYSHGWQAFSPDLVALVSSVDLLNGTRRRPPQQLYRSPGGALPPMKELASNVSPASLQKLTGHPPSVPTESDGFRFAHYDPAPPLGNPRKVSPSHFLSQDRQAMKRKRDDEPQPRIEGHVGVESDDIEGAKPLKPYSRRKFAFDTPGSAQGKGSRMIEPTVSKLVLSYTISEDCSVDEKKHQRAQFCALFDRRAQNHSSDRGPMQRGAPTTQEPALKVLPQKRSGNAMYKESGTGVAHLSFAEIFEKRHRPRGGSIVRNPRVNKADRAMAEQEKLARGNLAIRRMDTAHFILEELDSNPGYNSDIEVLLPDHYEDVKSNNRTKAEVFARIKYLQLDEDVLDKEEKEEIQRRYRQKKKRWNAGIFKRSHSQSDSSDDHGKASRVARLS